jgi:hypothetical protein
MKTAIYIEEGITQLVLTPENNWEENVVKAIGKGDQSVQILRGEFYECRDGWVRYNGLEGFDGDKKSLIIRLDKVKPSQVPM